MVDVGNHVGPTREARKLCQTGVWVKIEDQKIECDIGCNMGVSENRLNPIYPMVLLIIIPMKNGYFIRNIPYFQTNPHSEIV